MNNNNQMQNHNDEIEIDLRELWQELKKNIVLIAGVTTAFVVAAAVYSFVIVKPVYEYNAMIRVPAVYEQSRILVNTCVEVLKNDGVADVKAVRDSNIIKVSFYSGSQLDAKENGKKYLVNASEKVNRIIDEIQGRDIKSYKAEVIFSKTDEAFLYRPNKRKNIALAFIAGMFLSCGSVVTRYIFNKES